MKGVLGRCVPAALVAAIVVSAVSAANPASNGRILVFEDGDLFTVDAEGGDRMRLTSDGRNSSATFSPNGARIAFLKSDGSRPRDLYVINADGSGGARLIASHPESTNFGGIHGIAWSPDSGRLAYVVRFANPPIRIVDARDGTPLALPQVRDPDPSGALEWSPDGTELLYENLGDIAIKPVDGSAARLVVNLTGTDRSPSWSPDGSRIAFIHTLSESDGGVYVVRRDGTDLRHVAATGTALLGTVRWKPDGTAVVFDATVTNGVGPRSIPLTTTRILSAGAEGATIGVLRDNVAGPVVPSPDNGQLLIGRALRVIPPGYEAVKPGVYVMNADGTCLTLITTGTGLDWQRLPAVPLNPPRACVDLVLSVAAPGVTGLRGPTYAITVRNEGTLPATDVRLVLRVDAERRFVLGSAAGRVCSVGTTVTCRFDRIQAGGAVGVVITARPAAASPLPAAITVASAARDADPASNEAELTTRVYPCWISGTDFDDHLNGTNGGEHICGRAGQDLIEAFGGNDVVEGGWGQDTLYGGRGRDTLIGGRGNDIIHSRDGERDVVECGWGLDRAFVDRSDRVLRGCEGVHRP